MSIKLLKGGQLRTLGSFLKANLSYLAEEKLVSIEVFRFLDSQVFEFLPAFWILSATGCRWSELKKININDIQETGSIYVHGTKGSKDRLIKCFPSTILSFLKSIKFAGNFLFGFYSVYSFASTNLRYQIKATGIAKINKSLHLFRHCKVNTLLDLGVSPEQIQNFLGHKDLGSTQNYFKTVKVTVFH